MHLFALALAVELEAADAGHETAGLRWGRELVERRWERRLAALASMESLIDVERLSAEHAELQQHAFLDDLTGLANRRALARFTQGLLGRGVPDAPPSRSSTSTASSWSTTATATRSATPSCSGWPACCAPGSVSRTWWCGSAAMSS